MRERTSFTFARLAITSLFPRILAATPAPTVPNPMIPTLTSFTIPAFLFYVNG